MFCAISGQVPQHPVFCPKTGLLYEEPLVGNSFLHLLICLIKELQIRKAIEGGDGKCPVTATPINVEEDLCKVKASHVTLPRPPSSTSFPALLTTLQNEWDSLLVEQVNLRKELLETRKDLATALYEREAAGAVIARLLKENEHLKNNLEKSGSNDMETDDAPEKSKLERIVNSTLQELEPVRKSLAKKTPEDLTNLKASADKFEEKSSYLPHKSNKPGVSCVALESFTINETAPDFRWVVSGGVDGDVKILDVKSGQNAATLSKHKSRVNDISFRKRLLTSASNDKSVGMWSGTWDGDLPSLKCEKVVKKHSKAVKSCPIHPSGEFFVSCGADGLWMAVNVESGVVEMEHSVKNESYNTCQYHPDGRYLGVGGSTGILKVFNLADDPSKGPLAELSHDASINSVAFSENGYLLATAGDDGNVKVWDLRKLATTDTIPIVSKQGKAASVVFDSSGTYLAIGDSKGGVKIVEKPGKKKKEWIPCIELSPHKKEVTSIAFEPNAAGIWTASMDRTLKRFSI